LALRDMPSGKDTRCLVVTAPTPACQTPNQLGSCEPRPLPWLALACGASESPPRPASCRAQPLPPWPAAVLVPASPRRGLGACGAPAQSGGPRGRGGQRPTIWRWRSLRRLIGPSTGPLLHDTVIAALTAASSSCSPCANRCQADTALVVARASQPARRSGW
jgi:hypothetical protein